MALRKYRKALRYLDVCWEKEGIDEGGQDSLVSSIHNIFIYTFPSTGLDDSFLHLFLRQQIRVSI